MREEIRGYHEVRAAAKDIENYSSNLLGDRDVRAYRQLPLEADPPRHTQFRSAIQPYFMSQYIGQFHTDFETLALRLIDESRERGGVEISSEFALPYVIGCLGIIYNRPQDVAEWTSWGPDVWTADTHLANLGGAQIPDKRDGRTLQRYLDRVFDEAIAKSARGEEATDIWDFVARLEIDGQRIEITEMWGIANVLLAGGRDTVIKTVTGLIWHLVQTPEDRTFLLENQEWFNRTIAEMVRFLTPLPKMERAPREQAELEDSARDPEKYVLLNFVSANYDKSMWPDPDRLNIHRERVPHLAFGFGRHSCLGMNVTEHEVGAFLKVLLENWPNWEFDGEPEIEWNEDFTRDGEKIRYIDRFKTLRLKVAKP
jgi:cytochrome P450